MEIYSKIKTELNDFFQNKVKIAGVKQTSNARFLGSKNSQYDFSQNDMVNLIDLYYNSKFETGPTDSEGQRKIFLNICKFRADVAAKQTDLDVKHFTFIPTDTASEWGALFLGKEFKQWARENYFSELINHCVEMFPRYGWVVLRETAGKLEFVPLQILRNQQDATSLNEASFVILEHTDMTLSQIKSMKKWDISKLDLKPDQVTTVYERYGNVSLEEYNEYHGIEGEVGENEEVDCLTIVAGDINSKDDDGAILFMEKISKRPFTEAHWSKQYGRLMGVGEIENQIENQIGANMAFNLYRRQLLWSAKKIFQSPDDTMSKNLVRDVKDGDVLQISPNGNISQVDMSNRASGDFANFSGILEKNSDQKSFTYEVATGESLPQGTPFRLGVIMTNAVNSHFDMKREKLGLFFKRAILETLIPTFKKEFSTERIIAMSADESGFELLKKFSVDQNIVNEVMNTIRRGEDIDFQAIKQKVEFVMANKRFIMAKIPDSFYDRIKYSVTLEITGEEVDIPKKIETLTNLYTTLVSKGDPRAEKVLSRLLAYTGESYDLLVGDEQSQTQGQPVPSPIQPTTTLNQPTTPNKKI
jgi:hypothetical protein